ncbi:MAG: N-acetylneuraminate synthase family protein [Smithella sp.]|jgi:N-acetylneuraminate synthase
MKIKIGKKFIGDGCPTFIIAEGCDNHMGSLKVAKEMAKQAFIAGCDAIKFQHHLPDEEMLPNVPMSDNFDIPLYDFLVKNALKIKQHEELKNYCEQLGIMYLCTPFSWKAAQEINELGVEAFKIGSGEMTDIPTLERISGFGKPMIVSTGMCTLEEIDRTYNVLIKINTPLALTNCISEYPPVYEDINLGVLTKMIERYPNAVIGHSDHTPDLYTSFAAVVMGAKIIEKHVIISKQTPGPDQSVSIDFFDLHNLIDGIRKIEKSLGNEKIIHKKEEKIREWAFRSIVSLREIKKGETIDGDMIWSKRPGTGIPSYRRNEIIGKKVKNNIQRNTLIKWEDLE